MHTAGIHLHYFVLPGFDLLTRTIGLVGLRLRSQKCIKDETRNLKELSKFQNMLKNI